MYVKPETRNLIHCLQIVENTLGARTTIPVHSMEMAICLCDVARHITH